MKDEQLYEMIEQAEGLIRQNGGLREAFASVCQRTMSVLPTPKLDAVKQCLEHLMALEVMEEYGWRQKNGQCRKGANAEYWARLKTSNIGEESK